MEDAVETVPRPDVDLEGELENLRDWVKGHTVWFGHSLWLDTDEFETRVEQIITQLPKEVRRARRLCREEQRIIQDARDEARRLLEEARAESEQIVDGAGTEAQQIVTAAQARADGLVESSAIRQRALEQAEQILQTARDAALEVRQRSFDYSLQVTGNVSESLKRLLHSVEQDRKQLEALHPEKT